MYLWYANTNTLSVTKPKPIYYYDKTVIYVRGAATFELVH